MLVKLIAHMGDDLLCVNAARASLGKVATQMRERDAKLISDLMAEGHASPFGHPHATFYIEAPIRVAREHMRHRTQTFSEFSTRYSTIELDHPVYAAGKMRTQVGKPMAYDIQEVEDGAYAVGLLQGAQMGAVAVYRDLLSRGMAKEQAAYVLPLGLQTSYYATASLRNWLNFLSLRTAKDALQEIREVAELIEDAIANLFPVSYMAWNDNGRKQL